MADYGQDLSFPDLDLTDTGRLVDGVELLAQAVLIRLSTDRSVIDAPDDGLDIVDELSRGMTPAQVAALASRIENEVRKDERIQSAKAVVDASALVSSGTITVSLFLDSAAGPFQLVLAAGAAGIEILGGA